MKNFKFENRINKTKKKETEKNRLNKVFFFLVVAVVVLELKIK